MKQAKTAFSMVEMVLVLIIITVMAGIAMPRFSQALVRHQLDAAVRRVTMDLAYARKRAMQTSTPQSVIFDMTSDTYVLAQTPDPNHAAQTYLVDLKREPYRAAISQIEFRAAAQAVGDPVVVFDIYGMPDSGGSLTITVGKSTATITLDGQTGKVTTIYG